MFPIKKVKLGLRKAHVRELEGFRGYSDRVDDVYGETGVI
jgi:hypothetical protein